MSNIRYNAVNDIIWFNNIAYETMDCKDFADFMDMIHEDFNTNHDDDIMLKKAFDSCREPNNFVKFDIESGVIWFHDDAYDIDGCNTFDEFLEMIHDDYTTSQYEEQVLKNAYDICSK